MKLCVLKWCVSLAVIASVVLTGGLASAQSAAGLTAVGAVDPANGFPKWYKDGNGLQLAPCFTTVPDVCGLILAGAVPVPAAAIAFPRNFPTEFPYARLTARITGIGLTTGRADFTQTVLGTFAGGVPPAPGLQVVFARYRIRVSGGLVPGALYTVTGPFGVRTFSASAVGTINFTDNQGCIAAPCNFAAVLPNTNVGPFLTWDPIADAPAGFIGNALATHAITAGPSGNVFRIEGLNVGGPGVNLVETNLWTVAGQIFVKPATTTTLTSTPNPSGPGQTVTLTANVAPAAAAPVPKGVVAPPAAVPTGSVTFMDGALALGTAPLAGGSASFSTTTLAGGAHTLTAVYNGSDDFAKSTSAAVTQNVRDSASATTMTASPNPVRRGKDVVLTATVTAVAPAVGTPTGTVTFMDGATAIGTATLVNGTATIPRARFNAPGNRSLTAVYNGDIKFGGSVSPAVVEVVTP